jgi:O-antigen ligase
LILGAAALFAALSLAQSINQPQQTYVEDAPRHHLMAWALGFLALGAIGAEGKGRRLGPLAVAGGGLVAFQGLAWASTQMGSFAFAGTDWLATLSQATGFFVVGFALAAHARAQGSACYFRAFARTLGWLAATLAAWLALDGLHQHFVRFPAELRQMAFEAAGGGWTGLASDGDMKRRMAQAIASGRVASKFGNPNLLAAAMAMLWPWGLALEALESRAPESRGWGVWARRAIFGTIFGLALPAVCWLTGSRGGLLTLLFSIMATLAVLGPRIGRRAVAGWMALAAAGLALGTVLAATAPVQRALPPQQLTELLGPAERPDEVAARFSRPSTIRQRLGFLEVGGRMALAEAGWIGQGAGSFEFLFPRYQPAGQQETQSAHNWPLDVLIETGWIGLALWTALALYIAGRGGLMAFRLGREADGDSEAALAWACWASFATFQVSGLIELSARQRELSSLAWLGAGILMALAAGRLPAEASAGRRRWLRAGLGIGLAAAYGMMTFWGWKRLQSLDWAWRASEMAQALPVVLAQEGRAEALETARLADAWLSRARELFPESREPWLKRADLAIRCERLGLSAEAFPEDASPAPIVEEALREALARHPGSARTLLALARFRAERSPSDAANAERLIAQALERVPNSARIRREAAEVWKALGRSREAREALAQAAALEH